MMETRRGLALLLVLAAAVIVLTGTMLAIRLLVDTRRQLTVTSADDHLLDALAAGERLAIGWLSAHVQQVVLPPEGGVVALIDERWRCAQGDGALMVQLYDACAMIPARCAGVNGSLRAALPPGWGGVVLPDLPPGRDHEPRDWLETVQLPVQLRRFPVATGSTRPVEWSTIGTIADGSPPAPADRPVRLGLAMVASPHSQGAINLNTAPEALLRAAFQQIGAGGLDQLLQQRRRGLAITAVPEVPVEAQGYHFVTTSKAWKAHIQVGWNSLQRSWWVVIAGNPGEWRIVQRHDADR
jgi:hypothetical protein